MVFSSQIFVFYFLPLVLCLYYLAPFRARTALIAIASYVFYGWANPIWALIMFVGSSVDYVCGLLLLRLSGLPDEGGLPPVIGPDVPRTPKMRAVLVTSIVMNLGLLSVFKYTGFAAENVNALGRAVGLGDRLLPVVHLVLPVGISFYTFKAMSYAIDVYRGDARPMRRFTDYMCFEAFFPDLVAGPIIRYASIERQMRTRTHSLEKFARGAAFFAFGMGKKILVANPMGHVADTAFLAGPLHARDAWYGVVGYAFQIYFDFSGYSDMAIGLALMMGFVLMQNFDAPYKSESITEFWRRWHISLSTWLRDYLYVPLGGNRKGSRRTYANLMLVMLLGGLWHGASWNFVIWGGIHGSMLAAERAQGKDSFYRRLPRPLRVAVTFAIVCLAWVFFRAKTLTEAVTYLGSLSGLATPGPGADAVAGALYTPYHVGVFTLAALICWTMPTTWEFTERLSAPRAAFGMALLGVSVLLMWTQTINPFLYFQF
ncbi:MAG TPA: MBOAT family O-acyltransferase [Polyangiaceae bacterium]|jgi:alginate O-acetyltransferase complex protein AlgI|nr:MBOAT family O-acyltransferase [Polyangiaceae bacterium]